MNRLRFTRRTAIVSGAASAFAGLGTSLRAASSPISLAEGLAQAVVAASGPLTAEVAERSALTLLDGMGAMVHGAAQPAIRRDISSFVSRIGTPSASVVGHRRGVPFELAAAANAYLLHAEEVDDSDLFAQLRASAVILPTALAVAEAYDLSGAEFLRGLALGYTLQRRLAAPLGPLQRFGWMTSGVWGPPAAAAMAATMIRLDARRIAAALALGGSASGGSFQYFYDQTEEKRLIVARGARTAVESAGLAARGHEGARRILEGQAGLYRLFGGSEAKVPDLAALTGGLAKLDGPLWLHPKYFSASSSIIPILDGLQADLPRSIAPADIAGFTVIGDEGWARVLGDKIDRFVAPQTRIGAMTNFSFMVALFIARGRAMPNDLTPAVLRDPAILLLARRARFRVAPVRDLRIDLDLNDGRRLGVTARNPAPDRPAAVDLERRSKKFESLSTPVLGAARRDELRRTCLAVGRASSMRDWASGMRRLTHAGVGP